MFGHTNIDYLATVKRLPSADESAAFEGPVRALGGTAANIAAWAASLGAPVALASFVGDDFPREFERVLTGLGVDVSHLRRVRGAKTPVCWIFTDTGERQMAFINQGAAVAGGRLPLDRAAIRSAQVVHLATGPPAYHLRAARFAAGTGASVAFDPGQELSYAWSPSSFRTILRAVDVLFLNDTERTRARLYLGARSDRSLLRFVDALVLTHGARGSEYLSRREHLTIRSAQPRRIVNTTGAGDAFRGGYYAALFRGLPPRARLEWGAAAASFAVETPGGQSALATPAQLVQRMARSFRPLAK